MMSQERMPRVAAKTEPLFQLEFFRNLTGHEFEELRHCVTIVRVGRGHIFYRPGEPGQSVYIVKEGAVHLYRTDAGGKKLIVATLGPYALFDDMALFGERVHHSFAEAGDNCVIFRMNRTDLERLMCTHAQLALQVLHYANKRLHSLENKLESIAFRNVEARLSELLLSLSQEQNSVTVRGFTHQDLADRLGTYRETITQVLNELKVRGWIDLGRKRIDILNAEQLAVAIDLPS
jgi:CRP-like cAMP-binding protein